MHIIIVGGGGVGYQLAQNLSEQQQDVVVIEKYEQAVWCEESVCRRSYSN